MLLCDGEAHQLWILSCSVGLGGQCFHRLVTTAITTDDASELRLADSSIRPINSGLWRSNGYDHKNRAF